MYLNDEADKVYYFITKIIYHDFSVRILNNFCFADVNEEALLNYYSLIVTGLISII